MSETLSPLRPSLGDQRLQLEEVGNVAELFAARLAEPGKRPRTRRRFLLGAGGQRARLRVAGRLDVEADAVVFDAQLGTLGLVQVLPVGSSGDQASIEEEIENHIDKAAYLRHLLLEDLRAGEPQSGRAPVAVELVLVTQGNPASAAPAGAAIGEVLRRIMQRTTFLHAIGVNVCSLTDFTAPAPATHGFRRAFAWLLTDVRGWCARPRTAPSPPPAAPSWQIQRLTLTDFRLPGERRWEMHPAQGQPEAARLHLVHGQNGSGKSSLAEALELTVAGKIDRLETEDHAKVVTSRQAFAQSRLASVSFQLIRSGPAPVVEALLGAVAPSGITWTTKPADWPERAASAGTFRMDQKLADNLSLSTPEGRAKVILETFFPTDHQKLQAEKSAPRQAEGLAAAALQQLPERLRSRFVGADGKLDPERVLRELTWYQPELILWEKLLELLPVTATDLMACGPLQPPALRDYFARRGTMAAGEIAAAVDRVDTGLEALGKVMAQLKVALDEAHEFLTAYGDAAVRATGAVAGSLPDLIGDWLELVVLTDLLEKEDQVFATLEAAGQPPVPEQHRYLKPVLAAHQTDPAAAQHRARRDTARRLRDDARAVVAKFQTEAERAAAATAPARLVEEFNLRALDDLAAAGLFGDDFRRAAPALSSAVQAAFPNGPAQTVRSGEQVLLQIGESGWGKGLARTVAAAREATARLSATGDAKERLGSIWDALKKLHSAAVALSQPAQEAQRRLEELLQHGGVLSCAVNELMALLTPARWAYDDVVSRPELGGVTERLGFETTDKIAMSLRLNTAELNTFALALFLLCAREQVNPFRLLVLDDPLQNMDELTVTTVARGLGKLLRLWKSLDQDDQLWSIVLMLHGEENAERIRTEVPCVTHLLPWLSPQDRAGGTVEAPPILRQAPLYQEELQALDNLIAAQP